MSKPSILIIGGGAFGTSSAYHLADRGYSITVLDRFDPPSREAASTDLNKIVRFDHPNPIYAKLGREAMEVWKASFFADLYHETGWIMSGRERTRDWIDRVYEDAQKEGRHYVRYLTEQEVKNKWPAFEGDFSDWINLWNPAAGWVPSGKALLRMAQKSQEKGVKYVTGDAGYTKSLIYQDKKCVGAVTADLHNHYGDLVILATGANTATLLPEAKDEVEAQSSVISVIQLTYEEGKKYKTIPIVDDFEQAIMFPPDENNFIKLCSSRSLTNYNNYKVPGASIGHSAGDYPYDGSPTMVEKELRSFVNDLTPELTDRPWVTTRMCWDAVTKDLNFRICPFPKTGNLYVATMGSNQGFKFMPIIGKYVADMLEGNLSPEYTKPWAWSFGRAVPPDVNPHPIPTRDLSELDGWQGKYLPGGPRIPWNFSRNKV